VSGIGRRHILRAGAALTLGAPLLARAAGSASAPTAPVSGLETLESITGGAKPITGAERQRRRDKLSAELRRQGSFAALIEPGSSLRYFTGVEWWISERITAALITAEGELAFITPAFEESRLREMVDVPVEVLTWEEDEDPFALLGEWLARPGRRPRRIAMDEAVRHFIAYGIAQAAPDWELVSAAGPVNACRMIKSAAELALMQLANDVTVAAYRAVYPLVDSGMSGPDIAALMHSAQRRLGADDSAGGCQVGKGTALPHGSREPEYVAPGQVVLMDFGCGVGGYRSDISRTFVFGEPDARQRRLWNLVHRGQEIAFATAKPGTPAGRVDAAVREFYEAEGFGPGYQLPGLSHRTGHGIGLDVHEPINFVGNETTALAPGMCLSNEPGIYAPGDYGVRLEDCLYITAEGPRYFSEPPPFIDRPMG
jgi:Xaa-Pro dipeptidase